MALIAALVVCGLVATEETTVETQSKLKLAEYSATLDVLTQQLVAKADEVAAQEIELRWVWCELPST